MAADNTTILCVDDEEIPRTLRSLVLRKQGYRVIPAASAAEALAFLQTEDIDLLLTDQMMPSMCGTELIKLVKAERPQMPAILISGMNEIPADASLADRFVTKVGGPELLFRTILEVLAEHQAPSSGF